MGWEEPGGGGGTGGGFGSGEKGGGWVDTAAGSGRASYWPSCRRSDYADLKNEKMGDSSMILRNRPATRHNPVLQKISKLAKRAVL